MAQHAIRSTHAGEHRVLHSETRRSTESMIIGVVWFVASVIIVLLAFRFVLLLLGADPDAGFSMLVYGLSAPFMAPFFAVFGRTVIEGAVFEWSALLAIAVYTVLAYGIQALVHAVTPRASAGTMETVEEVHEDESTRSAAP